jgi:tripartite-type tricarboxylate transporter receptor subunit TctC
MRSVHPARRRAFLGALGGAAALAAFSPARAQAGFPNKPVKIIVGAAAGGNNDTLARIIAQGLTEKWGQPVVVENKVGANNLIATIALQASPPDGYTLMLNSIGAMTMLPVTQGKRFEPSGYTSVAFTSEFPILAVTAANAPWTDLRAFVAAARAQPGKLSYASSGIGSMNHLQGEYIKMVTKTDIQHIPYKGDASALADVLSGTVSVGLLGMGGVASLLQKGDLKALATLSGARSPSLPQLPTAKEQGIEVVVPVWNGVIGPPGMAQPLVDKINRDINEVMVIPALQPRFATLGLLPRPESAAWFTGFVNDEYLRWSGFVKTAGIKLN